ncbi:GNAT family N-acetyltransferase [Alloscardovia venturai]|uniref:GNAT family N-acetyltransferase n=1 Tax=Alloscardovia venturai TaxID=1769421 RepID=A0ABW2Y3K7_9BIFI
MNFSIRYVKPDMVSASSPDLREITSIYNEAVVAGGVTADTEPRTLGQRAEWVNAHSPREDFPVVVAESESGEIAGFASLSRFHPRAGYDGIAEVSYYVAKKFHKQGLGHQLLAWLERAARERGFRKLTAIIFADNHGSIALMKSHGFTRYGLLPHASYNAVLGKYHDVAYWYKDLIGEDLADN